MICQEIEKNNLSGEAFEVFFRKFPNPSNMSPFVLSWQLDKIIPGAGLSGMKTTSATPPSVSSKEKKSLKEQLKFFVSTLTIPVSQPPFFLPWTLE